MNYMLRLLLVLMVGLAACSVDGQASDGQCSPDQLYDSQRDRCVPKPANNPNNDLDASTNPDARVPIDQLDPWADESGDGVPNRFDNCPFDRNPDQLDSDGDGVGDVCDNCPHVANADQAASSRNPRDERGIRMGDACAPGGLYVDTQQDSSGDGVPDVLDNCPHHHNPDQLDTTGDGAGDACDNCPQHYNPDQTATPGNPIDARGIVIGDACAPEPNNIPICQVQTANEERLAPNIYIQLDISGSMNEHVEMGNPNTPHRWTEAVNGLDRIADELHSEMRFGLAVFPSLATQGGCGIPTAQRLALGNRSAQEIKNAYNTLTPAGGTPMMQAIRAVQDNNWLQDPTDPLNDERAKALILVTDGEPNCEATVSNTRQAAADLWASGIPVFVIGFAHGSPNLTTFARAGGTHDFYPANDATQLADAVRSISSLLVSCTQTLNPPPPDPNKIWISINGSYLQPTTDYTYDGEEHVVTLSEESCAQLRNFDPNRVGLEIRMGCAVPCQPGQPQGLCDVYYETCGEPHQTCDNCAPEVCDGTDNNCNGIIDDGCPDCGIRGASCARDSDCCTLFVCDSSNVCAPPCFGVGVPCRQDGDCCTNTCAIAGAGVAGVCISG